MRKILFLLLVTISSYGQTLQNPTFGNTTTNTLKIKTNSEASTSTKLSTQETDGSINWIQPINVPIPYTPINYSISGQSIGQQIAAIDAKIGTMGTTSAGITQRVYFTADNTTVNAVNYFASSLTGKGSTATGSPPALVLGDNTKAYFTKDVISIAQPSATIAYGGTYSGNLTVSATPTPVATQQRFTVEIYRTNNLGVPIASGVSGAPTGDLGVTVLAILDSGIINLSAGSITNVPVSGILTQNVTINTGERIRYHVSAAKIGSGGGNVTFGVYYGTSYNSYYDVPVSITTDAVLNKSTVYGVTATDAFNNLANTSKISKGLISGDSTIAAYLSQNSVSSYLVDSKDISAGNSITDISVPGNTIDQQKAAYLALSDKNTYDYVIVQIGLNDVGFTESDATVIARLQDYINTINANKKASCKVIIGTMTPAKQRWIVLYGNTNGAVAQAQWQAINNAIMSTITGVDFRQQNHTIMLNDGLNNLAGIYDMGDYIHENNNARQIIASEYRKTLSGIDYLKINTPIISSKYEFEGIKSYGTFSLPNEVAGIGFNAYSDGTQPRFIDDGYAFFLNSSSLIDDNSLVLGISNLNSSGYGAIPTFKNVFRANLSGVFVKDILAIGTDMPTSFAGYGTLNLNGSTGSLIEFKQGDAIKAYVSATSSSTDIFNFEANPIRFFINTQLKGSFTSAGLFQLNSLSGTGTRQVVADASGNLSATIINERPYTSYSGLISQIATGAPSVTVLENNTGRIITWTRTGVGQYIGTFSSPVTILKTMVFANLYQSVSSPATILAGCNTTTTIYLQTFVGSTPTDSAMSNASLEIRIYP